MKRTIIILLGIIPFLCFMACNGVSSNSNSLEKKEAREQLKLEVELVNKTLVGKQVDDVTTMTACKFDGMNLIYKYTIDENIVRVDEISESALKEHLQQEWEFNSQLQTTKRCLQKLGGNVVYKYIGSKSNKSLTITINV